MSTTGNSTLPAADRPLTQDEINAKAEPVLIYVFGSLLAFMICIMLGFCIGSRVKKYRAQSANNADDIELQQRGNTQRAGPEPAGSERAPGLFYLNQDHAEGVEAPPPSYSTTSIKKFLKGGRE